MTDRARVLVVDDEPRNVKLLAAHLTGDGFEAITAGNGEEALRIATSENPDVILLDIMMPDLDGFEVTRRLKANPLTRDIPVVLVTSLDGADNRVKGLDAGADEFLTKPVNRAELLARVRALQLIRSMQAELEHRSYITHQIMHREQQNILGNTTCLIVDDDKRLRDEIGAVLEQAGYLVVSAGSAAEAQSVLLQTIPDLIVLDLLLPDGDGVALMRHWRTIERLADVPIIIITALTDLERKIDGIEQGADDYLIKPIDNSELLARVRASMRRAAAQKNLRHDLVRLSADSVTDRLTGVRNRHYLDADLGHRFPLAVRNVGYQFSVAMVDVDHFKPVNDDFGHLVGDAVLRRIATQLESASRASDIVTRYGGEEFCVVMPDTDEQGSSIIGERLRQAVEGYRFEGVGNLPMTVSIGLATSCADDNNVNALLARADKALYQAKAEGRNRVCVAPKPVSGKDGE